MEQHKDLEIPWEEIASNTFHRKNYLGAGGFGGVYKGELSRFKERGLVAFKKLDRKYGQGETEFFKEIQMLSQYKHENIITLLGYSIEGKELILVYEYASRGSLDSCLDSCDLTWTLRLKICLQAAKGLRYLHDPRESRLPVIHRDIKSANILLDDQWNAKVSDFGLAKISPVNSNNVTYATGTTGYSDPQYYKTYSLTEKSDVYSFGVMLFEVLCGRLCYDVKGNNELLVFVHKWMKFYEQNKLEEIVFKGLNMTQMDQSSLKLFSDIAYKCLNECREKRPSMAKVVFQLEVAHQTQERYDVFLEHPLAKVYEEIARVAVSPLSYSSVEELQELLSEGVLINGGKALFCLNEKGQHMERIFIQACLTTNRADWQLKHGDDCVNSRFPGGRCYEYEWSEFKACVRGQYLIPQISYTLNLIFRYQDLSDVNSYNPLRYKLDGDDESRIFIIYPSDMRQDGWFIAPLYQFTSQSTIADLQFEFEYRNGKTLLVAGFEFQPSEETVELQVFEEYQDIAKVASQSLVYSSLDELKQILYKGVHLNGYKTWFSLNEKGEHYHIISMTDCLIPSEDFPSRYKSHYLSRFPAGLYQTNNKGFKTHVKTQLLSPSITYTVNLLFKSYRNLKGEQVYVNLKYRLKGETTASTVLLTNPRKDDDFLMAELYQLTSEGSIVDLEIIFENSGTGVDGVEGILFQPLVKFYLLLVSFFIILTTQVEDRVSKDDKVENIQTISDSQPDTYWEQNFPKYYEEILNLSIDSKKELYSVLRRGYRINNSEEWLTVDKHGKICPMLPARAIWVENNYSIRKSSHESRFGEVLVIASGYEFEINIDFKTELSPKTTYGAYFVYKLPEDQSTFEAPLCVWRKLVSGNPDSYIYIVNPPHTPVIGPKIDENAYNPLNRYKNNVIPQQRTDGWMEVKVWEFYIWSTTKTDPMCLYFKHPSEKNLKGLMVQGIELRPV